MDELIKSFQESLEMLDRISAATIFQQALNNLTPIQAVEQVIVPALMRFGTEWEKGNLALSQIYMSSRLCEELVERVLPPSDPDRKNQTRVAIVVLEDYHMLGKRIVYSGMRASGFELFDYGRMEVDELVQLGLKNNIRIPLISAVMLPSALKVLEGGSVLS